MAGNAKIRIIFNPVANKGKGAQAEALMRPLVDADPRIEWCPTQYYRHAVDLAFQAGASGCERVIAAGGDGTVHEVVNGLMCLPERGRPAIGVVPIGSGNDLAGGLGVSRDPAKALRCAIASPLYSLDIGLLRDDSGREEYWLNTLGIGFDAVINIHSRQMRRLRGFWMYLAAALQTIFKNYTTYDASFEIDGLSWRDQLLMTILANGRREGGGFIVAPQAALDDGRGDFIAIRRIGIPRMVLTLLHFIRGTAHRLPYARTGTFQSLKLTASQPLYIHTDGEIFAGLDSTVRNLEVDILPGAVKVARDA